ncbi:hypothetical protein RRG08_040703 [Elysia crispata]|uniref:Uncharacterized protein n=1 Tax=Elysia crispata TaxID=231223 RepID=A0AAE1AXI4_9GAST|nr:hypothetical protein RRG08_040703 [Elysia crispata]
MCQRTTLDQKERSGRWSARMVWSKWLLRNSSHPPTRRNELVEKGSFTVQGHLQSSNYVYRFMISVSPAVNG